MDIRITFTRYIAVNSIFTDAIKNPSPTTHRVFSARLNSMHECAMFAGDVFNIIDKYTFGDEYQNDASVRIVLTILNNKKSLDEKAIISEFINCFKNYVDSVSIFDCIDNIDISLGSMYHETYSITEFKDLLNMI